MKKIEAICRSVVHKLVRQEIDNWPPPCWGAFYQAKRPQYVTKEDFKLRK